MIESCTRRRMIISIVGLGILTILILILEEKLTSGSRLNQSPTPYSTDNQSGSGVRSTEENLNKKATANLKASPESQKQSVLLQTCWESEDFKIIETCSPCTAFEISSGTPSACELTGLKEVVHCNTSGTQYRSCSSIKSSAKTRFWVFESLMLLLSVTSYGYYKFRSSQLERATIKQIERRLASGL